LQRDHYVGRDTFLAVSTTGKHIMGIVPNLAEARCVDHERKGSVTLAR